MSKEGKISVAIAIDIIGRAYVDIFSQLGCFVRLKLLDLCKGVNVYTAI